MKNADIDFRATRGAGLLVALSLLVSACATLDEGQCRTGNWYQFGERDGAEGHALERMNAHAEACAEYGIRPNEGEYLAGRDAGLRRYCMLDNAIREGLAGHDYRGVCPPAVAFRFAELHRHAYAVHTARGQLDSLEREAVKLEKESRGDKTSPERRRHIHEDLRLLDRKIDRARDDLRSREFDLDRVSRRVAR
jgi:hypothetical protein